MIQIKELSTSIKVLFAVIVLLAGVVYYFSNPNPQKHYDYTFRVADNILRGSVSFTEKPPSWLNEFVPFEGKYYSVFPLGSVISMMPFAVFKLAGLIREMPAAYIAAIHAMGICIFLLLISLKYEITTGKRILLTLGILFGTWSWTNLTMGGAWQLALGFALLGQLGAIYFTVYDRRPFWAGLFFAMAFGNRTEVLLTAPLLMFLLIRPSLFEDVPGQEKTGKKKETATEETEKRFKFSKQAIIENWKLLVAFCVVPFMLGVATLIYNYIRFHSFTDFGYARIPGVLAEPWYKHGIFSIWYIPGQAKEMLWKPWETFAYYPYLKPNGFSSSILWSSPFLLFLLRFKGGDNVLKYIAWISIALLTLILWIHGNSGGWQFGYRYAMVLLPWIFLLLLETSPRKITPLEWAAYIFSFAANAYATWLFHWSGEMKV